jgi:hypothetical protein
MKRNVRTILILTALVALLGVAMFAVACGSSTDDTTTTAAAATTLAPETTTTAAATDTTAAVDTTVAPTDTTAAGDDTSAAASGTITVKGLADSPTALTVDSLKAMNPVTITAEHPKMGKQEYTGVRFSDLLTTLKVQGAAATMILGCSDGFMAEIPMADLKASADAMIAIGDDGTLNAVMPGMSGKAWAKDVVSMEFK